MSSRPGEENGLALDDVHPGLEKRRVQRKGREAYRASTRASAYGVMMEGCAVAVAARTARMATAYFIVGYVL